MLFKFEAGIFFSLLSSFLHGAQILNSSDSARNCDNRIAEI